VYWGDFLFILDIRGTYYLFINLIITLHNLLLFYCTLLFQLSHFSVPLISLALNCFFHILMSYFSLYPSLHYFLVYFLVNIFIRYIYPYMQLYVKISLKFVVS